MPQPVMTYRVEAHTVEPGVSEVQAKEQSFRFDSGAEQSLTLMGPAELLCAAFAACVLKNLSRFSDILPFRYDHASIDVSAERDGTPPRIVRIQWVLHIRTDEPERRVELLQLNIQKYGTIYNTLAATAEVSGKIVVTGSTGDPRVAERR